VRIGNDLDRPRYQVRKLCITQKSELLRDGVVPLTLRLVSRQAHVQSTAASFSICTERERIVARPRLCGGHSERAVPHEIFHATPARIGAPSPNCILDSLEDLYPTGRTVEITSRKHNEVCSPRDVRRRRQGVVARTSGPGDLFGAAAIYPAVS
jgi:hypothetical protein